MNNISKTIVDSLAQYEAKVKKVKRKDDDLNVKIKSLTNLLKKADSLSNNFEKIEMLDIECAHVLGEIKADLINRINDISLFHFSNKEKKYLNTHLELISDLESELEAVKIQQLLHTEYIQQGKNYPYITSLLDEIMPALIKDIVNHIKLSLFPGATIHAQRKIQSCQKEIEYLKKQGMKEQIRIKEQEIETVKQNFQKARDTRIQLRSIGGKAVKIVTPHSNLDATFMSVDDFRKNLKEAGGKIFTSKSGIQGYIFNSSYEGSALDINLTKLGINAESPNGWTKLTTSDGRIMLLSSRDRIKMVQCGEISKEKFKGTLSLKEIGEQSSGAGTAIVNYGFGGSYEIYKYETMALLLKGVNVMTFNVTGHGKSNGRPTFENTLLDVEAVYQYVKKEHGTPDEKILMKSLCLGGGSGSALAAAHPKINLLLDQSYSDLQLVLNHEINKIIKMGVQGEKYKQARDFLEQWATASATKIAALLFPLFVPSSWEIRRNITKMEGHLGIFCTKRDDTLKLDHVFENYKSMIGAGKGDLVSVYAMDGTHATNWQYIWERAHSKDEIAANIDLIKGDAEGPGLCSGHRSMDLFLAKIGICGDIYA